MVKKVKEFRFQNQNDETLVGKIEWPEGTPRAFVLMAHCFVCTKNLKGPAKLSHRLRDAGMAVARFDFTGLGDSEGEFKKTDFSSNVEDLLSAYKALEDEGFPTQILIGHSIGGAAVLKAACSLDKVTHLITIGAPSSTDHLGKILEKNAEKEKSEYRVHIGERSFLLEEGFFEDINKNHLQKALQSLQNKKLLVIHSEDDEIIDFCHGLELLNHFAGHKFFYSLEKSGHLLSDLNEIDDLGRFIESWTLRDYPYDNRPNKDKANDHSVRTVRVFSHKQGYRQDIYESGHHIIADEPEDLGGTNQGMDPYGLLLSALGACTSMTLEMYAKRKKLKLDKVEVELSHKKVHAKDCEDCGDDKQGVLDYIEKQIRVIGDLTDEQKNRLFEIAEKCPVNKTLIYGPIIKNRSLKPAKND